MHWRRQFKTKRRHTKSPQTHDRMPAIPDQTEKIAVVGHIGFDESTIDGISVRQLGGAAYYSAMTISAMKIIAIVVGKVGTDFPLDCLQRPYLDASRIAVVDGKSPVFRQVYGGDGQITQFSGELGVSEKTDYSAIPLTTAITFIAAAPPEQQNAHLTYLRNSNYNGLVCIDTAPAYLDRFRSLLDEFAGFVDILFCNEREHVKLDGFRLKNGRTVIKCGPNGARLIECGNEFHVSAPTVLSIRTLTGAGDVLAGAFLSELARRKNSASALSTAVEFASEYVGRGSGAFY